MVFYNAEKAEKVVEFNYEEGEFVKLTEVNHFYDENGEKSESIEENIETGKMSYKKYLKKK